MQWRTYQHAMHAQQAHLAYQSLMQEHTNLETQHKERTQSHHNQTITKQQLTALNESLGTDMHLTECVITPEGINITLTAPSRHRAQECVAQLNKKQLFGTLIITSLKTVKSGNKNHLIVIIRRISITK